MCHGLIWNCQACSVKELKSVTVDAVVNKLKKRYFSEREDAVFSFAANCVSADIDGLPLTSSFNHHEME